MTKLDLFASRMRVATADLACGLAGLNSIKRSELAQMVAMNPVDELPQEALEMLRNIPRSRSVLEMQGIALKAFWAAFFAGVRLPQAQARLWINPPDGLRLEETCQMTVSTQEWLCGRYGFSASGPLPKEVSYDVAGENRGFFDNVTVFWDTGVEEMPLADWVMPGSTLTLCRPDPAVHAEWIRWTGIDLRFLGLIGAVESRFKIVEISKTTSGQVATTMLGIESK